MACIAYVFLFFSFLEIARLVLTKSYTKVYGYALTEIRAYFGIPMDINIRTTSTASCYFCSAESETN